MAAWVCGEVAFSCNVAPREGRCLTLNIFGSVSEFYRWIIVIVLDLFTFSVLKPYFIRIRHISMDNPFHVSMIRHFYLLQDFMPPIQFAINPPKE